MLDGLYASVSSNKTIFVDAFDVLCHNGGLKETNFQNAFRQPLDIALINPNTVGSHDRGDGHLQNAARHQNDLLIAVVVNHLFGCVALPLFFSIRLFVFHDRRFTSSAVICTMDYEMGSVVTISDVS